MSVNHQPLLPDAERGADGTVPSRYKTRMARQLGRIAHINPARSLQVLSPVSSAPPSPLPQLETDAGAFGNPRLRFTVLYAIIIVAITLMPLWLPLCAPRSVDIVNMCVMMAFVAMWLFIAAAAVCNMRWLGRVPTPTLAGLTAARVRTFRHIVIVPCYLDPLDVLFDCLSSLLLQAHPDKLVVVCTFEQTTPMLRQKVCMVEDAFHARFGELLIVVHTLRPDREIPGGCSNKNFALRAAYDHITAHHKDAQHAYTVTTCDTDSRFHPQYFEILEACYNGENPDLNARVSMVVWQPPTFYNWDLDRRPFFVRVTGIMRSMMMLGGLVALDLNPMSIFSYPLEMGLHAGFINPRYSVDDIIAKVRWMITTKSSVPVRLLPCGVVSGPTIGTSWWEEVMEWGRQNRRWQVGASESWHFFIVHWRGVPFFGGIKWFFFFFCYYAMLLCSAGIFMVLAPLPLPWSHHHATISITINGRAHSFGIQQVALLALILQYVAFGVAFCIDVVAVRMLGVVEAIHPLRRLAHFVSAPFVLFVYSIITFTSIIRFALVGKRMAGHDMAAKDGMSANVEQKQQQQQHHNHHRQEVEHQDDERHLIEDDAHVIVMGDHSTLHQQHSHHDEPDQLNDVKLPYYIHFGQYGAYLSPTAAETTATATATPPSPLPRQQFE